MTGSTITCPWFLTAFSVFPLSFLSLLSLIPVVIAPATVGLLGHPLATTATSGATTAAIAAPLFLIVLSV
jgi:hypothetical protein